MGTPWESKLPWTGKPQHLQECSHCLACWQKQSFLNLYSFSGYFFNSYRLVLNNNLSIDRFLPWLMLTRMKLFVHCLKHRVMNCLPWLLRDRSLTNPSSVLVVVTTTKSSSTGGSGLNQPEESTSPPSRFSRKLPILWLTSAPKGLISLKKEKMRKETWSEKRIWSKDIALLTPTVSK